MSTIDLLADYVANKWAGRPEDQQREMAFVVARRMLPLNLHSVFADMVRRGL